MIEEHEIKTLLEKSLIIFVILFSFCHAYAQQQPDTNIFGIKLIEFRAGTLFSRFYKGEEGQSKMGMYHVETLENKFRTGFTAGISVILINAKHITFQPEMVYNLIHHDIKYQGESWALGDGSHSWTDANYAMDVSSLQISFMVKYKFGKIVKAYIGGGPFFDAPLCNHIRGSIKTTSTDAPDSIQTNNDIRLPINRTIGLFGVSGISIPYKRSNFGLEFRVYWQPSALIDDLGYKQSFCTLNLIYQWKRKENFW
jgi:hypothetical protein